jgi:hypothetical protein
LTCRANDETDPCLGVDCSGHGTCRVESGAPLCVCDDGYRHPADTGLLCFPVPADARGDDGARDGEGSADAPDDEIEEGDAPLDEPEAGDGEEEAEGDEGGCPAGFGECDGDPATSCETPLDTLVDCGACGAACDVPYASESCATGTCTLLACDAGRGDCRGGLADGCETPLDTAADCGGCGLVCDYPHAAESCVAGGCIFISCDPLWGDCRGGTGDGCETPLNTRDDCGGCGAVCDYPHAAVDCSSGVCTYSGCEAGYADCFGGLLNGCETRLGTRENCASCGHECSLPSAPWCLSGGRCGSSWFTVDVVAYNKGNPEFSIGKKFCKEDLSCCRDGYEDVDGEWLLGTHCVGDPPEVPAIYMRDYMDVDADGTLFGVYKNAEYNAGTGWVESNRCFANPDQPCGGVTDFPPQAMPRSITLPILPASMVHHDGVTDHVTPGAMLVGAFGGTWQPLDEHGFDPASCLGTGYHGRIWQRNYAFVVDRYYFGGDLGDAYYVYVLESESSGPQPGADWHGGQRFERYWYAAEWGRVRDEGGPDPDCYASPDAAHCDGVYDVRGGVGSDDTFNRIYWGEDYIIPPVCRAF